ncbi:MAG: radical SAM protein, partial [Deltaproteobacteria bacterium]
RGCPLACTFCVEGISYYNKINRFSLERVSEELEYMAIYQKGNRNLFIADSNFGMYKEDIAIAETIARVNRKYGFPEYIYATTGKNQKERILDCAKLLSGLLRVSATVQSLDKDVLKEVKRTNISSQKLIELAEAASESNANTYADVILSLPGDSKRAHFETIKQLVETGIDYLTLFTSILLDSTEMTSLENRKKYGMQTRFRVLPRCFGIYPFGAAEFISAETEEVCVANNTLSFEDYLECRLFDLTVGIFYNDKIFYELNAFLKFAGISIYDWLLTIHHGRNEFPESIQNVYKQYLFETESELWKDRPELENFIKSSPEIVKKYINGELGNNVFYTARAIVLVNFVEDIHIIAFNAVRKAMTLTNPIFCKKHEFYLKELERYSLLKKIKPLSSDSEEMSQFYFDFLELEALKFSCLPEKRLSTPMTIRFSHTNDQTAHLLRQLKVYGSSKVGMARLLGKNPVKKFYRTPSAYFPSDVSTDHDRSPADKVWQDYS